MSWFEVVPLIALAAVVFILPGLLVGRAAGLRGLSMWAIAGPVTVSVTSLFAIAAPAFGIGFSIPPLAIIFAALMLLALLVRYVYAIAGWSFCGPVNRTDGQTVSRFSGREHLVSGAVQCVAFGVAAAVIAYRFAVIIGSPEQFSQTYDNIYHLNAVRFILASEDGSSLHLGNLTDTSQGFYPAAWHNMTAVVAIATSTPIPVAVSLTNIVIGAVLWPLSSLYLIRKVVNTSLIATLVAGVVIAGFSAFPYLMIDFGVLYPNLLSISLLPVAVALAAGICKLGSAPDSIAAGTLKLLGVLPGLALAHPSTVIALIAFGVPVLVAWFLRSLNGWRERRSAPVLIALALALIAAYLTLAAYGWDLAGQSLSASAWKPRQSPAQAIGEAIGNAPQNRDVALVLMVLTLVGIFVAVTRRRNAWLVGLFSVGVALFVIVSASQEGDFRHFWTGPWYNDSFRLAALLPTVTLPLIVLGGEFLLRQVAHLLRVRETDGSSSDSPDPRRSTFAAVSVLVCCVLIAVTSQFGSVATETRVASTRYFITDTSALLTKDELALLEQVPDLVPDDAKVYGDPFTGASLVSAIAGRETIAPHVVGKRTEDELIIMSKVDEAGVDPSVCPAVERLNAYYALQFNEQEVLGEDHPNTAMDNADTAPGLELIAREGDAKLFAVRACM